ncbi:dual specificity testis-specific protein kinase 2-like isoform X3 [Ptychodera flava]|uniref:dual specificity testis-specific protein kinase 2-like isoform X3 n=1 Tax=Ptychodera flava TaxID=63121 RepID=UPI00396AA1FB
MAAQRPDNGLEATAEGTEPEREPRTPLPGSSCFALLSAVTKLATWEDFEAEKLDSGFFADVYKVTNHSNGDVVVVKIGKSKCRVDQIKLVKELELMNKLDHPNVLKLIGACIKEGQLHPMLEYISGGCLQTCC